MKGLPIKPKRSARLRRLGETACLKVGRLFPFLEATGVWPWRMELIELIMSEPVSEAKFPSECTGNFIRSAPAARKTAENKSGRPVFYERIPYAFEQGIFRRVAGN